MSQNKQLEALFDLPPTGLPDAPKEVVQALVEQDTAIEAGKGSVHRLEDWGRRQLAYPINKIHKAKG